MKNCCKNCIHWKAPVEAVDAGQVVGEKRKQFLECLRNPPQILVGSYMPNSEGGLIGKILTFWPRTGEDQCCGEFSPREGSDADVG